MPGLHGSQAAAYERHLRGCNDSPIEVVTEAAGVAAIQEGTQAVRHRRVHEGVDVDTPEPHCSPRSHDAKRLVHHLVDPSGACPRFEHEDALHGGRRQSRCGDGGSGIEDGSIAEDDEAVDLICDGPGNGRTDPFCKGPADEHGARSVHAELTEGGLPRTSEGGGEFEHAASVDAGRTFDPP
jgi:hypothetical protein